LYGWKVEDRGPAHLTKSQLWGDGCPEGASIAAQLVKHSRGEAASKREAASSVLKQVEVITSYSNLRDHVRGTN
jgi:hypothetical protein